MQTGTVKWFNAQKGYGFIQPSSGGPDVFVHISAVERAGLPGLKDGQKVSYEIVTDRRSGKASADQLRTAYSSEISLPAMRHTTDVLGAAAGRRGRSIDSGPAGPRSTMSAAFAICRSLAFNLRKWTEWV